MLDIAMAQWSAVGPFKNCTFVVRAVVRMTIQTNEAMTANQGIMHWNIPPVRHVFLCSPSLFGDSHTFDATELRVHMCAWAERAEARNLTGLCNG
jgi:hypothetical protein